MPTLILLLLSAAIAMADSVKTRLGGPNLDEELHQEWMTYIKDQAFPLMPPASKLAETKLDTDLTKRQRYILHVGTSHINKKSVFNEGYHYFNYKSAETGRIFLVVHPKFRDCFDDVQKKFDQMQMVVFPNGKPNSDVYEVIVEKLHQCRGDFAGSGGKLKKAK